MTDPAIQRGAATTGLTADAIGGLRWSYIGTAAGMVAQIAYTASMSRLLSPAAFGVVALGNLLLRFVTYFGQLGVGSALVQKPTLDADDRRSAFTISLLIGGTVAGLVVLLAPIAGRLFQQEPLVTVLRGLAVAFFITALGVTSAGTLRRQMRFRDLALCELGSFVSGYLGVGLWMAFAGAGVLSLVGASIAKAAVFTTATFVLSSHSLVPHFDRQRLGQLFSFGGRVALVGFTEFLTSSLDTLAVGSALGAHALGFYNRANLLVGLPVENFSTSATKVLFPSFSSIQGDRERVAGSYVGGIAIFLATIGPLCGAIAASAPALVRLLLGPGWDPVAGLVPFVALAAGTGMVTHLGGVICEALGLLREKLMIQLVELAALLVLLAVVMIVGRDLRLFAAAWAAAELLRHALYVRLLQREIQPRKDRIRSAYIQGAFLTALPMTAMLLVADVIAAPPAGELAAQCIVGLLSYLALFAAARNFEARQQIRDRNLLSMLRSRKLQKATQEK